MKKVYILHGWAVDRNNEFKWADFRAELEKKGFETVFLKLPGLSSNLNEEWVLDDYVYWLDSKFRGKKDIFLLGHSFGGQLAVRYNKTHKKQIKKLILIDSAGIIDRSLKIKLKRIIFGVTAKLGKKIVRGDFFRKFLYKLAREKDYYNAPETQRRTMVNVINEEIIDDLSEIDVPTLIIWGSDDTTTPLKNSLVFAENIANSKLEIIPKSRHAPQFTRPHKVAEIVAQFLS